jgi:pimeloyl-ACP methyl ester carboxylesterase
MVGSTEVLITYEGCQVRYEHYVNPDRPVLLLVHGGGAHRGWWHAVVPHLVEGYELVVPDLSGNGDSEHRDHYAPELWAGEMAAILEDLGRGPSSYVGHSMGGLVGVFFAARHPDLLERLVLVDTSLRSPEGDGMQPRGRERRPTPVYATLEAALASFRLRPEGTSASPDLLEEVARQGLRRVNGGWTWKFDPVASRRFTDRALHEELPSLRCPTGVVYGQHSEVCGPHTVAYLEGQLGRQVPAIEVPGAYHHVPLDAPDACAAAVEEMIGLLPAPARPVP